MRNEPIPVIHNDAGADHTACISGKLPGGRAKAFIPLLLPLLLLLVLFTGCDHNQPASYATLTVKAVPGEGGAVEPEHSEVEIGDSVQVSAEASEDWVFSRWEGDVKGSGNPLLIEVEGDMDLAAVFEPAASLGEGLSEWELTFQLTNTSTESEADGVHIAVEDGSGKLLGEGETEEGSFSLTGSFRTDSTYALNVTFAGHGYIDFDTEIESSGTETYRYTIDPAEIQIDDEPLQLEWSEATEIDLRDYITSQDPDDDEMIELTEVAISGESESLDIEQTGDFTFSISPAEGADASEKSLEVTASTAYNTVTGSLTVVIGDPDQDIEPRHLVIMPLGDSITNDGRSRIQMWNLYTADGHTVDYVGDQRQETHIPDPDHEGVGGITIQEVHEKAASLMRRHEPEFINLMIGTNNIAWYVRETAEETAERWDDLVQEILDSSGPDAWIVAATIPPVTPKSAGHDSLEEVNRSVVTQQFNEFLREYIEERRENGDNIILADMEAEMNLDDHVLPDPPDGVHLTAEGYELMGTIYYEAITTILHEEQ